MSRFNKTFLWIASIAGIVLLVGLFGRQTATAVIIRYEYRNTIELYETLVPLRDHSIAMTPHTHASFAGYEFELPESKVDESKSRQDGNTVRVTAFQSGNALWFSAFPPRTLLSEILKDSGLSPDQFRLVYGDQACRSDYEFNELMLAMTPAMFSPFEKY